MRQPSTVFGTTLRALRIARGVSQETFAFECGLNRQFISILELGDQSPSLDTVFKVAAGLDMTAAALVADIEARMQAAAARKKRSSRVGRPGSGHRSDLDHFPPFFGTGFTTAPGIFGAVCS